MTALLVIASGLFLGWAWYRLTREEKRRRDKRAMRHAFDRWKRELEERLMTRMGAVDREPAVPKGRIRVWTIEHNGYLYQVVEKGLYESACNALMSASVVAGVLFVALVAVLVWR